MLMKFGRVMQQERETIDNAKLEGIILGLVNSPSSKL